MCNKIYSVREQKEAAIRFFNWRMELKRCAEGRINNVIFQGSCKILKTIHPEDLKNYETAFR